MDVRSSSVATRRTYAVIAACAACATVSQNSTAMTLALAVHLFIWVVVLHELTRDINKEARMNK